MSVKRIPSNRARSEASAFGRWEDEEGRYLMRHERLRRIRLRRQDEQQAWSWSPSGSWLLGDEYDHDPESIADARN